MIRIVNIAASALTVFSLIACAPEENDDSVLLAALFLANQGGLNTQTTSLKANEPVAQKVNLTAGQEFTVELDISSSSSGDTITLEQADPGQEQVTLGLHTISGRLLKKVSSQPGDTSLVMSYTPTETAEYYIEMVSNAPVSVLSRLQGGSASTKVATVAEIFAGSPTANIQVAGVIDSGYAFIKVNSINPDTRQPTFITTATVEVYVNGVKYDMAYVNHSQLNETYWNDTSGIQGPGTYNPGAAYEAGNTVRVVITDSANNISLDESITIPEQVTDVVLNGVSGTGINTPTKNPVSISRSGQIPVSWTNPSSNLPAQLGFQFGPPEIGQTFPVFIDPGPGSYTFSSAVAGNLSTTAANDCAGITFSFSGNQINLPNFYNGLGPNNESYGSTLFVPMDYENNAVSGLACENNSTPPFVTGNYSGTNGSLLTVTP